VSFKIDIVIMDVVVIVIFHKIYYPEPNLNIKTL